MNLSNEQQAAVEREGQDVCVVAGPGSGKTRVLTERFAWLIEQRGVDPQRILAITFTEKAAIEIKQRLVKRFAHDATLRAAVERAWVSTIDGFCTRLLKENAIAAGLAPDFAILDQAKAERMQREAAEAALDALFTERPVAMRAMLEAVDLSTFEGDDLAAGIVRIHEAMRVSGATGVPAASAPDDVWAEVLEEARKLAPKIDEAVAITRLHGEVTREHWEVLNAFHPNLRKFAAAKRLRDELKPQLEAQWAHTWFAAPRTLLMAAIERFAAIYQERKRREAVVDFADLEAFAVQLLESNDVVRRETVDRFDEILMDELQDTNHLQWRLVELVKSRLYAVGDINQSIYGFRHADPDVFAKYRDGLRARGLAVDELRDNYRSRADILATVDRALEGQPGMEDRPLNARGDFKDESRPFVERLQSTGDDGPATEAAAVAARIQAWHTTGAHAYGEIAILVRTLAAAEPFEDALERAQIPFLLSGGRGFLEARETRDVLLLIAALVNVRDEIPLLGVLRGPMVGLSEAQLYKLGRAGWQRAFEERFGETRQLAGLVAPDRLIAQVLDGCGYLNRLTDRARANVEKLLAWLRREFRDRPRPLAELLDDLEALRDAQTLADAPPPEAVNVVRIMTVHAAKGLEFPVVFVSALHKGADRSSAALLFSRTLGLGVKWRHPISGEGVPDHIHARLKQQTAEREAAESNRLLYVAMTRAERRLILSHAERRNKSAWEKLAIAALPTAEIVDAAPPLPPAWSPDEAAVDDFADAPVLSGQYDSAASITSVAIFQSCPRRYYLSRYLGLEPEPDGQGTGAMALGTLVHAALAGQVVDSPEALALAARFRDSEWGRRAVRAQRIEHESDFLFDLDDIVLRGQIDLWFEEAGERILVDYKTDRDETSAANYALQLQLYALALERYAGGVPDRAVLFYVRAEHAVEVPLDAAALGAARQTVRAFRVAQESGVFPLRPGAQCQKCAFYAGLCPEGREGPTAGRIFGPPSSFLTPPSDGL